MSDPIILVIQIPAYNEEESLPAVLDELPKSIPGVDRIILQVIDDGSQDTTSDVALAHGADYVIRHTSNQGLSRAFMTGITYALTLGANIIVNTDADGQYSGEQIPQLVEPILQGKADMVIGDRQPGKNQHFPIP